VVEVLRERSSIVERPDASEAKLRGHVRFEGVRFGYEPARPVLDGLTLEIEPGTSLALVGETGAGKSTVAGLLARFYDTDEGSVSIDGVDLRDLRLVDLRRAVASVFSETFLFTDTVR